LTKVVSKKEGRREHARKVFTVSRDPIGQGSKLRDLSKFFG
jgi:hypothetical protein